MSKDLIPLSECYKEARAKREQKYMAHCKKVDDAGEYYNFGPAGCGIEESRNLTEEEAWLIIETLRSVME